MRNLHHLHALRVRNGDVLRRFGSFGDDYNGIFEIPSPIDHQIMFVMASRGEGWEHVSISRKNRCPNWPEMCAVKDLFFAEEEAVMQFHPPKSAYVNFHPYCLHLWRPMSGEILLPPEWMVGPKQSYEFKDGDSFIIKYETDGETITDETLGIAIDHSEPGGGD